MRNDVETLAYTYSRMADGDLQRLALDMQSLVPSARDPLRRELERRRLPVSVTPQAVGTDPEAVARIQEAQTQARSLRTKIIWFFAGDILFVAVCISLVPHKDQIGFGKLITTLLTGGTLFLKILSSITSEPPLSPSARIRMMLAVLVPVILLIVWLSLI